MVQESDFLMLETEPPMEQGWEPAWEPKHCLKAGAGTGAKTLHRIEPVLEIWFPVQQA